MAVWVPGHGTAAMQGVTAKKVHAIESSSSISWAKKVAKANGFDNKIIFHQCNSLDLNLNEKVDLVISELIGHIAFEEGIAGCLADAGKRFLVSGGKVIPSSLKLCMAMVAETDCYQKYVNCWENVGGIDFSCLRQDATKSVYITKIDKTNIISEPSVLAEITFKHQIKPEFNLNHVFTACKSSKVTGLGLWFNSQLADGIILSSEPGIETHWQQCFVPVNKPLSVKKHQSVFAKINLEFCPVNYKIENISVDLTTR